MRETSGKEIHDKVEGKDWLKKEACIRCDEKGSLLICNVRGCPIAIHENCMSCKPNFDNEGKFYCPYCSYKRALIQAHKLRKKAMAAKKALSSFIGSSVSTGNNSEKKDGVAEKVQNQSVQVEHDQHEEKDSKNTTSGIVRDDGDGPAHPYAYNSDTDSIESDTESPKDFMTKQNSSEAHVDSRLDEGDLPKKTNRGAQANTAGGESPLKRKRPVKTKDHKIKKQNNSSAPRRSPRTVSKETGDNVANKNEVSTSKMESHESINEKTQSGIVSDDDDSQPHPYASAVSDSIESDSEPLMDFKTTENFSEGVVDEKLDEIELLVNTNHGSKDTNAGGESPLKRKWRVKIKARKIKKQQNSGLPRRSPRALFKENEIKGAIEIEGVSKSKMSKESPKSVKKFKTLTHPNAKRKRLPWTTEEEEMLRVLVNEHKLFVNKFIDGIDLQYIVLHFLGIEINNSSCMVRKVYGYFAVISYSLQRKDKYTSYDTQSVGNN